MRARGFTILELMIVVSLIGAAAAGTSSFYLEARVSAARIELQVHLQREASLVAEVMARDLRGARHVRSEGASLDLDAGRIRYSVEPAGLVRVEGAGRWLLSRHVIGVEHQDMEPSGHRVHLRLFAPLIGHREVRIERNFVARSVW